MTRVRVCPWRCARVRAPCRCWCSDSLSPRGRWSRPSVRDRHAARRGRSGRVHSQVASRSSRWRTCPRCGPVATWMKRSCATRTHRMRGPRPPTSSTPTRTGSRAAATGTGVRGLPLGLHRRSPARRPHREADHHPGLATARVPDPHGPLLRPRRPHPVGCARAVGRGSARPAAGRGHDLGHGRHRSRPLRHRSSRAPARSPHRRPGTVDATLVRPAVGERDGRAGHRRDAAR